MKSTDERLFEALMDAGRRIRAAGRGHGPHEDGPFGGPERRGPGPGLGRPEEMDMPMPGPGPHHGQCGCRGPRGRGPLSRERVLELLSAASEGLRQKELAEKMGVNASSMSEFIDHLEDGGYVERTVDPDDKRATRIHLTAKGEARAMELEDERTGQFQALFEKLTEEEKETLIALLAKVSPKEEEE
jgi:DNA-binding MarR family transcriptional regulator